jgi:hypothetical protein
MRTQAIIGLAASGDINTLATVVLTNGTRAGASPVSGQSEKRDDLHSRENDLQDPVGGRVSTTLGQSQIFRAERLVQLALLMESFSSYLTVAPGTGI